MKLLTLINSVLRVKVTLEKEIIVTAAWHFETGRCWSWIRRRLRIPIDWLWQLLGLGFDLGHCLLCSVAILSPLIILVVIAISPRLSLGRVCRWWDQILVNGQGKLGRRVNRDVVRWWCRMELGLVVATSARWCTLLRCCLLCSLSWI